MFVRCVLLTCTAGFVLACAGEAPSAPAPAPAPEASAPARAEPPAGRGGGRRGRKADRPASERPMPEVDGGPSDDGPVIGPLAKVPDGAGCWCTLPGADDPVYWRAPGKSPATMNLDGQDRTLRLVGERSEGEQQITDFAGSGYVLDLKLTPGGIQGESVSFDGLVTFKSDGMVVERKLACGCGA